MDEEDMIYLLENWSILDLYDSETYELFRIAIFSIINSYHEQKYRNKLLLEEIAEKDKLIDKLIDSKLKDKDRNEEGEER